MAANAEQLELDFGIQHESAKKSRPVWVKPSTQNPQAIEGVACRWRKNGGGYNYGWVAARTSNHWVVAYEIWAKDPMDGKAKSKGTTTKMVAVIEVKLTK